MARLQRVVAAAVVAGTACAVVQCPDETTAGCSAPQWEPRWDVSGSLYMYCFETCGIPWLMQNASAGSFRGVVGVDHYWTGQGMPCIDGVPQEFNAQDNYTRYVKATFPQARVLQYRITSAVPYAQVVHDRMLSHPSSFVHWSNGSMCLMPYAEHKTGLPGDNCSWPIIAAAYNWSDVATQQWWLESVLQPVMTYADGAWIDGDGPDNGAWMCSGSYQWGQLPAPYPALDEDGVAAFCAGERAVVTAAQQWLIANGGFDYNCFSFLTDPNKLPIQGDSPATCASKLQALSQLPSSTGATVLYGDRTDSRLYNDTTVAQSLAVFMLTRGEHWFFGFPNYNHNGQLNGTTMQLLLGTDFGAPLGNMTKVAGKPNVFQRSFETGTVQLDCNAFAAAFTPTGAAVQ